jgi:hypothetical protein
VEAVTAQVRITVSRTEQQLPVASCTNCLELVPASLLLQRAGDQRLVEAYQVDGAGRRTRVRPAWQSSNASQVRVDANGMVTALTDGSSAQLTASANGLTAAPALVLVATPAADAQLVTDAQVVGEIAPMDPTAAFGPGWRYRVRLRNVTANAGQVILSAENAPIGGRVVSVTPAGPGLSDVVLEVIPASSMFPTLRLKHRVPLTNAKLQVPASVHEWFTVSIERGSRVRLTPRHRRMTAIPAPVRNAFSAPGSFTVGPFDCETVVTTPSFPLTVTVGPVVITPALTSDLDLGGPGPAHFLVSGDIDAQFEVQPTITGALQGEVTCKLTFAELVLPFGGPLSLLLGGKVPLGFGFGAAVASSVGGLGVKVQHAGRSTLVVGWDCAAGGTCPNVGTFTSAASIRAEPVAPQLGAGAAVTVTWAAFLFADLKFASPILLGLLDITVASVKGGVKHAATMAGIERQRSDPALASNLAFSPLVEATGGVNISALGGLLQLPLVSAPLLPELPPTARTARGSAGFVPSSVAAGVNTTVDVVLDAATLSSVYEVESVELFWYKDDGTGQRSLVPGPPGCNSIPRASPNQQIYSCTTQFAVADSGLQEFHAFVKSTVFGLPFPILFELNDNAVVRVDVVTPTVRITPRTVTVGTAQSQAFTATVTGSLNQAVTWTATGGTISNSGVYVAGAQAGTFRVIATSVAFPTRKDTATVTVTNSAPRIHGASFPTYIDGVTIAPVHLTASGGDGTYSWSATGLPPGLSITSSTGSVIGTPSQPGTFTATIRVTSAGLTGSAVFTILVGVSPVVNPWLGPGGQASRWSGTAGTPPIAVTNVAIVKGTLGPNRYQIQLSGQITCFILVAANNSDFTGNCQAFVTGQHSITGARSGTTINAMIGPCGCTFSAIGGRLTLVRQ